MNKPTLAAALAALLCTMGFAGVGAAAPIDRRLEISINVDGKQDWRNALQWSKATTTQAYNFSTTLRSDGKLEGANLLDPNMERRMAIKTEYLRRKGAVLLKAAGFDPAAPDIQRRVSEGMQKESFNCKGDTVCISGVGAKYASLMAAAVEPDNSKIFEGEPRYQFFSAYPGCDNKVHSVLKTSTAGETGYGRNKDKIFPYAMEQSGDFRGNPVDLQSMCTYYLVVVDTKEQKMFVENVFIPASSGKVMRTEFGKTHTTEAELPIPAPLQGWVNETLRHNALSGSTSATLPLNMPLDGNSTVLGNFTGDAKVTVKWAWVPVAATSLDTPPSIRGE